MDSKKLEQLGLSKSESQIYLRLLELGSSKVGKLSKELPYNRTTIYKALDKLIQKGLVSSILRENTKYFEASSPKNLKENLEKEKLL